MDEPEVDPADYESFEVTIPVRIIFDPNRVSNRLLMRIADCEVEVTESESGKRLGAAGGAIGSALFASVGHYVVSGAACDFWKAVRAKLEELKDDLWEAPAKEAEHPSLIPNKG